MKLWNYLKDSKAELAHVKWPTQKQATIFTVVVIVISLLTAAYLGALDLLFTEILSLII